MSLAKRSKSGAGRTSQQDGSKTASTKGGRAPKQSAEERERPREKRQTRQTRQESPRETSDERTRTRAASGRQSAGPRDGGRDKPFAKRAETRDGARDKPFAKRAETRDGARDKPFAKRAETRDGARDKPFAKRAETRDKPFAKRSEPRDGGRDKPFAKRAETREGARDKPFAKRTETRDKPFAKRAETRDKPFAKPAETRDGGRDKPSAKRPESRDGGRDKPSAKRPESRDGGRDKPFAKRPESRDGGRDKPFAKRAESRDGGREAASGKRGATPRAERDTPRPRRGAGRVERAGAASKRVKLRPEAGREGAQKAGERRPAQSRGGAAQRDEAPGAARGGRSQEDGARPLAKSPARREERGGEARPVRSSPIPRPKQVERTRPDLSSEPHPGHFLLTTREGSEQDLVDELALLGILDPPARVLAPSLVLAPKVPRTEKRPVDLTFARQGFPVLQSVRSHDLDELAARTARSLRGQLERAKSYGLHVWVPDSTLGNPLSSLAEQLEERVARKLAEALPDAQRVDDGSLRRLGSILLGQVCLLDPERAVSGVTYSNAAISLAKGGRTRVRVTGDFPSRAARKLEEALAWLGVEPGPGELCVDLGAAPGGWTYVLAERRARVLAIDPAKLRPEILAKKGVRHLQESAFTYAPEEPIDWLFCDMAWRPLEAAALLAKWGRKRWARMLVANIKLPMTRKAEMVARVRGILENEGNWKHVRAKQLYHDRDEITLSAHAG